MFIREITEGFITTWGRNKGGIVRRYRCTDGPKKGRVVAKPQTCTSRTNSQKSNTLKRTRAMKGRGQQVKRSWRQRRPNSVRLKRFNKNRARSIRRSGTRRRIRR
tara:strand:+ start:1016 stop:1330 length:315 start_codon:yes stop_codon:yes gene_type:complete